ncbi:MAG TPA: nucleotidyltransferase family protein [Usitatibacter sp.]|nr:nucleotidyltransferase family protein [Usitatibacter sp.]
MPSQIRGLLMCGGLASRFGSDKLATMLDGEPLVAKSARNLLAALGNALAVIPPGAERLYAILDEAGCEIVETIDCARGLGASIAAGVAASATCDGWIVALGDMPFIRPGTIAMVAGRLEKGAHIAAPILGGIRGHPVGFARSLKAPLLALDGDDGAKVLLSRHRELLQTVIVDDPGVTQDVDFPSDLAKRKGA